MPREGGASSNRRIIGSLQASVFTGSSAFADEDDGREDVSANNELSGKVAIVTGAGRNIGRAIALALADGGASIVVNARSNRAEADAVTREIEAAGVRALAHIADVADAGAGQTMADMAGEDFGPNRILIQNEPLRQGKTLWPLQCPP